MFKRDKRVLEILERLLAIEEECVTTTRRLQAALRSFEVALLTIANADRSYPDKKIADDMQYCARSALQKPDVAK